MPYIRLEPRHNELPPYETRGIVNFVDKALHYMFYILYDYSEDKIYPERQPYYDLMEAYMSVSNNRFESEAFIHNDVNGRFSWSIKKISGGYQVMIEIGDRGICLFKDVDAPLELRVPILGAIITLAFEYLPPD